MHAPTTIPLLRQLLSWLGCCLFQLVLMLLYGRHLTRAFRSPFRANELPPRSLRPRF